jgi:hypothetical protein
MKWKIWNMDMIFHAFPLSALLSAVGSSWDLSCSEDDFKRNFEGCVIYVYDLSQSTRIWCLYILPLISLVL